MNIWARRFMIARIIHLGRGGRLSGWVDSSSAIHGGGRGHGKVGFFVLTLLALVLCFVPATSWPIVHKPIIIIGAIFRLIWTRSHSGSKGSCGQRGVKSIPPKCYTLYKLRRLDLCRRSSAVSYHLTAPFALTRGSNSLVFIYRKPCVGGRQSPLFHPCSIWYRPAVTVAPKNAALMLMMIILVYHPAAA